MISQSRGTIEAGKTLALTVTIKGNSEADTATAVWTSSNEAVATVDQNGNVTAVGVGTCVITVTSADPSQKATCSITVTAAKEENTKQGCNGSGSVIGIAVTGTGLLAVACALITRRKKD